MENNITYISYDQLMEVYAATMRDSEGGFSGVRDESGIRAVLEFVQNDDYYPTFNDKLSYLVFRLCTGHFFNDANKRIALTVGLSFLLYNKRPWKAAAFLPEMEMPILHVAAGRIDDELFRWIVEDFMENPGDRSEALKVALLDAISNGTMQ